MSLPASSAASTTCRSPSSTTSPPGLQARGLLDAAEELTDAGRATKARVEALTDVLAAAPYDTLSSDDLDRLVADLEPVAAALTTALDL